MCNFSPKSKFSLTLLFLLYINQWDVRRRDKFLHISSSSHFFSPSPFSSSSNFPFAGNFCNTPFFVVLRWVSCIFTLVFMLSLDDCWWELFKLLEMFYCHEFMFNWCGISRVWSCLLVYMKELRSAANRTHRVCMSSKFSGFNTDVFAFLWYF